VETTVPCPKCKKLLTIKSGRNGLFLACSGYPKCSFTANFSRDEKGTIVMEETVDLGKQQGTCEICGKPMIVKTGKFGPFLACSGYPDCKNTRPLGKEEDIAPQGEWTQASCKKCDGTMIVKRSRTGQKFLACENYPHCKYTEPISTNVPCPEKGCTGKLVERASKRGRRFFACNQYPKCRFAIWDEPVNQSCPECGTKVLVVQRPKAGDPTLKCRKKGCGFTRPLEES
jgi:DNA topoisomerase-1